MQSTLSDLKRLINQLEYNFVLQQYEFENSFTCQAALHVLSVMIIKNMNIFWLLHSLMRKHGYRYILQTDDDAFLEKPFTSNLIQLMTEHKLYMAARVISEDEPAVLWGLAELAKFFLLTELVSPISLFNHCSPHNFNGVYSR